MADNYFILLSVPGTSLISLHRLYHLIFIRTPHIMYHYNFCFVDEKLRYMKLKFPIKVISHKKAEPELEPRKLFHALTLGTMQSPILNKITHGPDHSDSSKLQSNCPKPHFSSCHLQKRLKYEHFKKKVLFSAYYKGERELPQGGFQSDW